MPPCGVRHGDNVAGLHAALNEIHNGRNLMREGGVTRWDERRGSNE